MPANCKSVTRPGPFGNPFVLSDEYGGARRAVLYFRECLERAIHKKPFPASPTGGALSSATIQHFENMATRLHELRGFDLCCWCKDGKPCHCDPLIELANR